MSNKINYDLLQKKQLNDIKNYATKPKLLIHVCCAPCSTACLEKIINYFDITVYFYNPNITNESEYNKRLIELQNYLKSVYGDTISLVYDSYESQQFLNAVKGYENEPEGGKRCQICYALRLDKTANYAKTNGYDYFTTTLSVSPHKNAEWLNKIGENLSSKYNVNYLYADFKKQGGYLRSIELSKQNNLYRQNYCGCEFSKTQK